jgi:hypothetical protein
MLGKNDPKACLKIRNGNINDAGTNADKEYFKIEEFFRIWTL